jgi:8-oxo-dGTP pyrophosphatase MutT (NUDIX family)
MAHLNYYLDLCVEAYIVHDDAVLLRLHEKYNLWTGPGGHIDPGEDCNEAALREVWEEAGLKIELVGPANWEKQDTKTNRDLVPPLFMNRHRINDVHEHSALIFIARAQSRDVAPQTQEDKGVEFRWVTKAELDEMNNNDSRLRPEVYKYALAALNSVVG